MKIVQKYKKVFIIAGIVIVLAIVIGVLVKCTGENESSGKTDNGPTGVEQTNDREDVGGLTIGTEEDAEENAVEFVAPDGSTASDNQSDKNQDESTDGTDGAGSTDGTDKTDNDNRDQLQSEDEQEIGYGEFF